MREKAKFGKRKIRYVKLEVIKETQVAQKLLRWKSVRGRSLKQRS